MGRISTLCNLTISIWALTVLVTGTTASGATVRHVYNWSQLRNAVVNRAPGDEIIAHPGVYNVSLSLYMTGCDGLILRGSTGNPEDVILRGPGMNNPDGSAYEGFYFASANMTLADLTVEEFYHHCIHFTSAGDGGTIDNVIVHNSGSQYIKGSKFNDDLIIRNTLMIQTKERLNGLPNRQDNYTGGIDMHGARNFHIHDNVAIDIIPGDAAIFLWNETSNGIIERNVVVGCNRGIALGNPSNANALVHARDVIIRNNFVTRGPSVGIELSYVKDVQVYNNTVYGDSGTYFRSVQLLDDYNGIYIPMENVELAYNIIRGNIRDYTRTSPYILTGNIIGSTAQANWFADTTNGDLHLTDLAGLAIDGAQVLTEVAEDIDGDPRPLYGMADVGADEYRFGGDVNGDGVVNLPDILIFVQAWDTCVGDANYDPQADFNHDGCVNLVDVLILASHWGETI